MVAISKSTTTESTSSRLLRTIGTYVAVAVLFYIIISFPEYFSHEDDRGPAASKAALEQALETTKEEEDIPDKITYSYSCPYSKLSDLTPEERFPKASAARHTVDPPVDTKISLVCCKTSQGPWSIAVHHAWAPIGAKQFMDMVLANHFSTPKVPLMRCIHNFLCQFGLNGASGKRFGKTIPDDPQWLPAGPDHRVNAQDVRRFQRGYMSYAGGGPNTRSQQLFVALADNGMLGGGSPWEVPWGELVGAHSYATLDKIYTGYGEHGPGQGMLHQDNAIELTERDFPNISWILGCRVVDETG